MNILCDHYWLVRRGGDCQHCKDSFPGNYEASKFERQAAATRAFVVVWGWKKVDGYEARIGDIEAPPAHWRRVAAWADELECDYLTLDLYEGAEPKLTTTARLERAHPDGPLFLLLPTVPVQLDIFLQEWAESRS